MTLGTRCATSTSRMATPRTPSSSGTRFVTWVRRLILHAVYTARLVLMFPFALAAQTPRRPLAELPIRAHIAVPASADWMATGLGSLWVVNYKPSRIANRPDDRARGGGHPARIQGMPR